MSDTTEKLLDEISKDYQTPEQILGEKGILKQLTKDGKPFMVYGTMGGEGQPQTQTAIAARVVDFGMSPQDAITAPRWLNGRTWGAASNDLKIEGRVAKTVTDELAKRGQPVKVVDDYTDTMGHAGAIMIDPVTKVRWAATDPRGDGAAVGY